MIAGFTHVTNRRYNVDPVLLVSFYGNRIVSGIEKDASYFVAVVCRRLWLHWLPTGWSADPAAGGALR